MVFASYLREKGDQFRQEHLNSNDISDRTQMPAQFPSWPNGTAWMRTPWPSAPALGGPFLGVHWRCGDYVSDTQYNTYTNTASPFLAAKQISEALRRHGLNTVFLATDATDYEIKILEEELAPYNVVRFTPSRSDWLLLGPGGLAIVDQWICAHARVFIGTSPSTFTFRITEERTIMGFSPESTFNTLCPDGTTKYYTSNVQQEAKNTKACEALTFWPIKLESGFILSEENADSESSTRDEL
ncbi:unnamed protein product [Echinostoma caproni]|uniref:GDP-fucose protein O-fucosyltransferase 2 n=1 Tax=Echinostoma caproni TaxID=27848 RepID=A0A183ADX0_9TREM|nr:unnamed protein product [Echinostoma caproni]